MKSISKRRIKKWDIYEITIHDSKRYLQFIYADSDYLGLDLVRVFNLKEERIEKFDLNKIIESDAYRYFHTSFKAGINLNCWNYIENNPIESDFEPLFFRGPEDYGNGVGKSMEWYLIQGRNKIHIGELTDEYKNYPMEDGVSLKKIIEILELGYNPAVISS